MSHVNCWLLALSFLLGLVLTLAFMIRRVKREVPVYGAAKFKSTSGAKPKLDEPKTQVISKPKLDEPKTQVISKPKLDEPTTEVISKPKLDEPTTEVISKSTIAGAVAAAGAAGLVGGAALAGSGKDSDEAKGEQPYGAGSFRLVGGASVPAGWTIKGNEDSMLYHTTDSPSYKQTIAEVWFRDAEAAEAAGFTHWKQGRKGASGAAKLAATEPEIPPGPHGPGSATPEADGSGPVGWTVKGNEDSMLYHSPESPAYDVTVAEVWFRDVPTAEAAGFNRWDSGKSQRGKK
jgi:hypothetical protein